jgi:glycosyltransferase involved in cell wall biosynthesis
MRIAAISLYLPTGLQGGVPKQVHLISNEQVRRGHQVTVFSLFPRPADALYDVQQVELPGWAAGLTDRRLGAAIHLFPWYLRTASFSGYDLIHAHGDSHFISSRAPVVRTFHSSGLDEALASRSLGRFAGMLSIYPFEIISGFRADARIFVSSNLKKYYPFHAEALVPNCVDLQKFRPAEEKSKSPSVLFVSGTIRGRKRGDLLIEEFSQKVLPRLPEAQLWMVCGEGVNEKGIEWFGSVSEKELVSLYQQAWVFCSPSSHENFGVPLIEAMACGTAVVSTPNAGAREVLANGRYGRIVESNKLGETLAELLQDSKQREELSRAGLEYVQRFSVDKVVDAYEAIYERLIATTDEHR